MIVAMNRIEELDFARVLAMLSVITIHVTSTFVHYNSRVAVSGMNLAFILNQLSRFAVPLFILLSGVSCGLNGFCTARQFLRRRLIKTGVPYLIWSLVYMLYNIHADLSAWSFDFCVKSLLSGQAAPHLYFVVIIMQLYVLFPVLKKWADRFPFKCLLLSFIVSHAIQKLFYFLQFGLNLIPDLIRPWLWILFPTWLFYFTRGLLLTSTRLIHVRKIASQNSITITVATLLFACVYIVESSATNSLDSIKSSLNAYVPLVFLFSFAAWNHVGRLRAVRVSTRFLAKHSMTIYFEHVLVLYFFRRFSVFNQGMLGMLLLLLAVSAASCLLAVPVDRLTRMVRVQNRDAFSKERPK